MQKNAWRTIAKVLSGGVFTGRDISGVWLRVEDQLQCFRGV